MGLRRKGKPTITVLVMTPAKAQSRLSVSRGDYSITKSTCGWASDSRDVNTVFPVDQTNAKYRSGHDKDIGHP